MLKIIFWVIAAGLLLLASLTLMIVALIKKRKTWLFSSFGLLILAGGFGIYSGYLFVYKSYHHVSNTIKKVQSDSGPTIERSMYNNIFGKADTNCLEFYNHQRMVIPIMDQSVLLHFRTCPEEFRRLLKANNFHHEAKKSSKFAGPGGFQSWFEPELLGDTIQVYEHPENNSEKARTLYSNLDSTEVFYAEIYF